MRLKHFDYNKLVIETYSKKRENNELSPLLTQSTPGNIRRECATVYQERYEKKDEPMLRAFFGAPENSRKFLEHIQEFDVDRLRPLDKYLKGDRKKIINGRNLELLAWLINFRHRPYVHDNNIILSEEELSLINETTIIEPLGTPEEKKAEEDLVKNKAGDHLIENISPVALPVVPKDGSTNKKYKWAAVIFLMLICSGGLYAVWQKMRNANNVCARWVGDHYEEISCDADPKGGIILSMNPEKIKNFRKITRQDTITDWSIGKLYYIKNNKTIECYTESGNYPEDLKRPLKVLSRHMYEKYLLKKDTAGIDSLDE